MFPEEIEPCTVSHKEKSIRIKLLKMPASKRTSRKPSLMFSNASNFQQSEEFQDSENFKTTDREMNEMIEIAEKEQKKSSDLFGKIQEIRKDSCKYSKLKQQSVVRWLKTRYSKFAK